MIPLLSGTLCLAVTLSAVADVLTVDDDGPANFNTIQAAVDAASHGDIILVEPGVYTAAGQDQVVDLKGKALTLQSTSGALATVIDGEDVRRGIHCKAIPNPGATINGFTIKSGYHPGYGGGIYIAAASPKLEKCHFVSNYANARGGAVMLASGHDGITHMTDCTFTDNASSSDSGLGGALHLIGNVNARGCSFLGNSGSRGGAIYIAENTDDDDSVFIGCLFEHNVAGEVGGALGIQDGNPIFDSCSFQAQRATQGGAVHAEDGSVVLIGCAFDQNIARLDAGEQFTDGGCGGAIYSDHAALSLTSCTLSDNLAEIVEPVTTGSRGGAICAIDGSSLALVTCTFTANAADDGGSIATRGTSAFSMVESSVLHSDGDRGAGIYSDNDESLALVDCFFTSNGGWPRHTSEGGGLSVLGSHVTLNGCTFAQNRSDGNGSALYVQYGEATIEACKFEENEADLSGAVAGSFADLSITSCAFDANVSHDGGAVFLGDNGSLRIHASTFHENSASAGGAVLVEEPCTLHMEDTVVAGNQDINWWTPRGGGVHAPNRAVFENCTFSNNRADSDGGHIFLHGIGTGSVISNCAFHDGEAWGGGAALGTENIGSLTVTDSVFTGNGCNDCHSGAVQIVGDGDPSTPVLFEWCEFRGNGSSESGFFSSGGGAIGSREEIDEWGWGRGVGEKFTIRNSVFRSNVGVAGGSIFGIADISNCYISGSASLGAGGAVNMYGGTLTDCYITGSSDCTAAGVSVSGGNVALTRVTITNGSAAGFESQCCLLGEDMGAGLHIPTPDQLDDCYGEELPVVTLEDTIICNNSNPFSPNQVWGEWTDLGGNHITETCCLEDLNHDGRVDGADLTLLLGAWGQSCLGCQADFDFNGVIDGADLTVLLGSWGGCD